MSLGPKRLRHSVVRWSVFASVCALAAWIAAIALAGPKRFEAKTKLRADDLNASFDALEARIATLESELERARSREPFEGLYPAIIGATDLSTVVAYDTITCGPAPQSLPRRPASAEPSEPTPAQAIFGRVIMTDAGAVSIGLGDAFALGCATEQMCAAPLVYYLSSKTAQTFTLTVFLDDAGAVYLDGQLLTVAPAGFAPVEISVPEGKFELAFMSCSTNGVSCGLQIMDRFIELYDLELDYDRALHRSR